MIKKYLWIILAIIVYLTSYYCIGNTIFRMNSSGIYVFSPLSIVESFIAPFRVIYLTFKYAEWKSLFPLLLSMCHFSNPYFTLLLFYFFF